MKAFRNRTEAGQELAKRLSSYAGRSDVIVLGLPRGGVPVAYEVAKQLGVPLDVFLVRKLGVPWQEELAMGAIASGGVRVLNREVLRMLNIPEKTIDSVAEREQLELERRELAYRGSRPLPEMAGRTIILVDDGLATGTSMRAAIVALRAFKPASIVVAVPVAPPDTCDNIGKEVDEIICAVTPEPFWAIGMWYDDFTQTMDREVRALLDSAATSLAA